MPKIDKTLAKLRRIALNQQGLLKQQSFGRGKMAVQRAIEKIGYLQIDTISVVERAHHHVLWSRVPNYQPKFLDELVKQRLLFEYWFHAAAWLPIRDYRFALPRMHKRNGERDWYGSVDKKVTEYIMRRIEQEGGLRARDFEDPRNAKQQWWDWKPAKIALEQLFMSGELMVSARRGFQKVYDLPERVLPDWVDTSEPSLDEFATHLIDVNLSAHGFITTKSVSYLRKGKALRDLIKNQLNESVASGVLSEIELNKKCSIFILNELQDARAPAASAVVRILSPFDNLVIQRERLRDVFNFDYQIECYLPEAKRKFGYFCLPLLYLDKLVGRIDCKAQRKQRLLEVKSIHIESPVDDDFPMALQGALESFAAFNGCDDIVLPKQHLIHW